MLRQQYGWWSWGLEVVEKKKDESEGDKDWGRYSKEGGMLDTLSVSHQIRFLSGRGWTLECVEYVSQILSVISTLSERTIVGPLF